MDVKNANLGPNHVCVSQLNQPPKPKDLVHSLLKMVRLLKIIMINTFKYDTPQFTNRMGGFDEKCCHWKFCDGINDAFLVVSYLDS